MVDVVEDVALRLREYFLSLIQNRSNSVFNSTLEWDGTALLDRLNNDGKLVDLLEYCLNRYLQEFHVGPHFPNGGVDSYWKSKSFMTLDFLFVSDRLSEQIKSTLRFNVPRLEWLLLCLHCIVGDNERNNAVKDSLVWRRVCFQAQRIMRDYSPMIMDLLLPYARSASKKHGEDKLPVFTVLEFMTWARYYNDEALVDELVRCMNEVIDIEFKSQSGKRTKYQDFTTSHLYLCCRSKSNERVLLTEKNGCENDSGLPETVKVEMPRDIDLDHSSSDSYILSDVKFEGDIGIGDANTLSELERCYVLMFGRNLHARVPFQDPLVHEQMAAVLRPLLMPRSGDTNWSLRAAALHERCRWEKRSTKRLERCMAQLTELVEAPLTRRKLNDDESSREFEKRREFFFAMLTPSPAHSYCLLADVYKELGAVKSQLDVFKQLEEVEQMIVCYKQLGMVDKAEKLIRDLIQDAENESTQSKTVRAPVSELYVYLGDVTHNVTYYDRALELTGGKSYSANRQLGMALLSSARAVSDVDERRLQIDRAVGCLRESLAVNPLQAAVWFRLGTCLMSQQNWTPAAEAFVKCANLTCYDDSEDGAAMTPTEALANLSTCYRQAGKLRAARHSMEQALKKAWDNWRMWENYLGLLCHCVREIAKKWDANEAAEVLNETAVCIRRLVDINSDDAVTSNADAYKTHKLKVIDESRSGFVKFSKEVQFITSIMLQRDEWSSEQRRKWLDVLQLANTKTTLDSTCLRCLSLLSHRQGLLNEALEYQIKAVKTYEPLDETLNATLAGVMDGSGQKKRMEVLSDYLVLTDCASDSGALQRSAAVQVEHCLANFERFRTDKNGGIESDDVMEALKELKAWMNES